MLAARPCRRNPSLFDICHGGRLTLRTASMAAARYRVGSGPWRLPPRPGTAGRLDEPSPVYDVDARAHAHAGKLAAAASATAGAGAWCHAVLFHRLSGDVVPAPGAGTQGQVRMVADAGLRRGFFASVFPFLLVARLAPNQHPGGDGAARRGLDAVQCLCAYLCDLQLGAG